MKLVQKIFGIGVFRTVDDLTGNLFSFLRYISCRIRGKMYFGSYLAATQGKVIRHYYMQEIVKQYCRQNKQKIKILEIGSWAGGSAITWADAIKKYNHNLGLIYCVDPWIEYTGSLKDQDSWVLKTMSKALLRNKIFHLFNYNVLASGHGRMISPLKGESHDILALLRENQFDIIFIDGNHAFEAAYQDILHSAPLVKHGGIICGDDLELQYRDVDTSNIKALNHVDIWTDPQSGTRFHPGVTLAVWKYFKCDVSCWDGFWAMRKNDNRWESVELKIDRNNVTIPEHFQ